MPLVRIDVSKTIAAERVRAISDVVYRAMNDIASVPLHDKFHVITRHERDEIVYPQEGYLEIDYSDDLVIIQVTWVAGRSTEIKKQFYRRVADELHDKHGFRRQDIWINLVDTGREDWSFGNGYMQYAPQLPSGTVREP